MVDLGDDQADGAWLIPLPVHVEPVSEVRGTVLVAGREQLRITGIFESYSAELSPDSRAALDEVIAVSWVPVELAHAHYAALDRLRMDPVTIERTARVVASKLNGIFFGTTAQAARVAGVTPWAGARIMVSGWGRLFKGGAPALQRVGPKEAIVVAAGNPLLTHRYHRIALRVNFARVAEMFTHHAIAREIAYDEARQTLNIRLQWV